MPGPSSVTSISSRPPVAAKSTRPPPGVAMRVARELRDRRGDARLVLAVEAQQAGDVAGAGPRARPRPDRCAARRGRSRRGSRARRLPAGHDDARVVAPALVVAQQQRGDDERVAADEAGVLGEVPAAPAAVGVQHEQAPGLDLVVVGVDALDPVPERAVERGQRTAGAGPTIAAAMLPMPAKRSAPVATSSRAIAAAAPRVGRRAACIRSSCSSGGSAGRSSRTAVAAASAASLPCPSPSARSTVSCDPARAWPHASPLTSSPCIATTSASTSRGPVAPSRATRTAPRSAVLCTSKLVDSRPIAPSPVPAPPAVENPSRSDRETSFIPRPRSHAMASMAASASGVRRRRISPPPPWRTRFVASSVTTIATSPARCSSNPSRAARSSAARRAGATPLASSTASRTGGVSAT